ncbi:MAG: PAS domain S-box protein, partial [Bacteroidetes bacterium]|nr:PAS domain S-box protein [Bacteroidota bacterium]
MGGNIFPVILNALEESLFLLDNNGKLTWYNKACSRLYQSVSGKPFPDNFDVNELLTQEQQLWLSGQLQHVLGGREIHFEWHYRQAGSKWLAVSLYPFTTEEGLVTGICGSLRDITGQKQNEKSLLLKTATLDSIGEGVIMIDRDGNILTFNKRAGNLVKKIGGCLRTGENFAGQLPQNRREAMLDNIQSALQGKQIECEGLYPADTWLLTNFHPVKQDNGRIGAVSISFRDITERKRTEDLLKKNEQKYRTLVNALSEGVILQTHDRKVLTINKNAALILGVTPGELMESGFPLPGWRMVDRYEKEISPEELFHRKKGRSGQVSNKVIGLYKGDTLRWIRFNIAAFGNDQQGEAGALLISFEDITEQKRLIREMRVLSMVARETPNAVLILGLNGETVWVNEGFMRLTGYSLEEIADSRQGVRLLPGQQSGTEAIARMTRPRGRGQHFVEEQLIYHKDGRPVWIRSEGQPMRDENGAVTRFFVIMTDITAEKRLEEERMQQQVRIQKEITRVAIEAQEAERNGLGRELHDNVNQLLATVNLQLSYCINNNYRAGRPVLKKSQEYIKKAIEEIRCLSHKMVTPHFAYTSLQCELS